MTINTFILLPTEPSFACAACGAPLRVGETVYEYESKSYCGPGCVNEAVGQMMARAHSLAPVRCRNCNSERVATDGPSEEGVTDFECFDCGKRWSDHGLSAARLHAQRVAEDASEPTKEFLE